MISKNDVLQYKWLAREEGFIALEHEIIFRDLCSGCGVCAAVCLEDVIEVDEFPKLTGKCTNCGYCLIQCPRSFFSWREVESKLYGRYSEEILGKCELVIGARSRDKAIQGQDGGFVTALLKHCFEKKIIDGAIVSCTVEELPWKPLPKLITSVKELQDTSGTRYSNSPSVALLKEAKKRGLKRTALVGLPCQIEGLRKVQFYPVEDVGLESLVKFTVALFCKSNFLYEGLMKSLIEKKYKIDLNEIKKLDIKGKELIVTTGEKEVRMPLAEAHAHVREGCRVCHDFTSRLSDFSVGSIGSKDGYSTVFARTKMAKNIIGNMKKELDTVSIGKEKPGLETIELLQNIKSRDARKNTRKTIKEVLPMPFKHMRF
ncbi:MAG: Coenzyme F420 hydrogenase/dehydrogenase, beta subunit C-terminal domain [Candidatus Hydrothermarchaeaceae archaeon]